MKKAIIFLMAVWFSCNAFALERWDNVDIHGFISQGYLITTENNYYYSETKDGTFQFNDIGLNFGKDLTPSLRIGIQFMAKDLGIMGNDEIKIDYAMADYNYRDWLGLRVGKIKKALGLYNQTRDVDAGRLNIFLPQSIYHEIYRDEQLAVKGLSFYGRLFQQLDYQAYYGVLDLPDECGITYIARYTYGIPTFGTEADTETGVTFLWNTPLNGLNLGGSYSTVGFSAESALGTIDVEADQILGSLEYTYGNFMFSGEFLRHNIDITIMSNTSENYYASAAYRLTDWFEFGGGYSAYCFNTDFRDEAIWNLKDAFLSLRFDINAYWIFKLEGHAMDGLLFVTDQDPSENWQMFAAKVTYSF